MILRRRSSEHFEEHVEEHVVEQEELHIQKYNENGAVQAGREWEVWCCNSQYCYWW